MIIKNRNWKINWNQINFSFRTCKNPGVYEIELAQVYEFMNSDEYLGGMSLTDL
jgi:hypothetical protein